MKNLHRCLVTLTALQLAACGARDAEPAPSDAGTAAPSVSLFDILLGDLSTDSAGIQVTNLKLIADRDGYENQPYFTRDGTALLFTVVDSNGRADIYRYDLIQKTTSAVTQTRESEYSAYELPNGGGFSVVRVEMDSTQRLWAFDMDGAHPRLLIEEVEPVGYYAWGNESNVALFVLGDPNSLQVADLEAGTVETIETSIGASIQPIPGREAISFVHKRSDTDWQIKAFDIASGTIEVLAPTRPGSEHHTWTPRGTILMGEGPLLFEWAPETGWREVANLSVGGFNEVSRLAVSADGSLIAVVVR